MNRVRVNIILVDSGDILYEGIAGILLKSHLYYKLSRLSDIEELELVSQSSKADIIIVNTIQLINRERFFRRLKKALPDVWWIDISPLNIEHAPDLLFDASLRFEESSASVISKISKMIDDIEGQDSQPQEQLTERERELLVWLVKGLSNKEIADKMSISIHTVISHRKSITHKTGIKSQSGLTIYALTQKIVTL